MSTQQLKCACGNTAIKTEHYTNGVLRVECECGVSGPWVDFFSMNDEIAKNEACRLWTEMQNKLSAADKARTVLVEQKLSIDWAEHWDPKARPENLGGIGRLRELVAVLSKAMEGGKP